MSVTVQRLLLSLVCVVGLCTPVYAATYYISPSGLNSNAGTSSGAPWLTFTFALPRLAPGDTLILVNGTYTAANSGVMQTICGTNATNGTAAAPITVKAQNERQAFIQGNGSAYPLLIIGCSYWTFEGIRMESADNPALYAGSVVGVFGNSQSIILRRLLLRFNNRYDNSHGMVLASLHNSLIEENEIYSIHRHGISLGDSSNNPPTFNTFRRNYINSRAYPDLAGGVGRVSGDITQGDTGISCYPCNNTIFENNITESWNTGFDIQATWNTVNNKYLGHISLSNDLNLIKARADLGDGTINIMPRGTRLVNFLAVNGGPSIALYLRSNKDTRCDNCTIIGGTGATAWGIFADQDGGAAGDGVYTIAGSNLLIANNAQGPFNLASQNSQLFDEVLVFGNGAAAVPAIPHASYTNVITSDPALGTCKVFIPTGSPAKGTGVGGADIGANILYRYQAGVLTTSPLWDPTTGAFPCGAQIAGVNNVAGSSCFDVHERLNVNFGGCTLPGSVVDTAENFYVSPTGTGNCLTVGTPCQLGSVWGLLGAGDTVNMANGTYTGANSMLNPPPNLHGASGTRITVKATNAGQVLIDGQYSRMPFVLDRNNYWTIEDINVSKSTYSTIILQDSVLPIVRKVVAWGANDTLDSAVFWVQATTGALLQDVAGFGNGRHALHLNAAVDTVILRGFFLKNNSAMSGQAVVTSGKSTGTIFANIIASVDLLPGASISTEQTIGPTTYVGLPGFTGTTTKILGSIAYAMSTQTPGTQTALIEAGMPPAFIDTGDVVTTITDNILAIRRGGVSIPAGILWSQDGVKSLVTTDHWTDSPGVGANVTEGTIPGEGGTAPIFDGGLLQLDAETQPADGAWIEHCYTSSGTLNTGCNLWPWQMNARIQDALISSGWAAQGGLDGSGGTDLTAFIFAQTENVLTLPLVLVFDIQPVSYVEDAIRPATKVCVYDSSTPAILQTNYATAIVVAIEDNPSSGTLSGTSSIMPTNGCSNYSDRSINNAGIGYSFEATSGALTPVESASFDVIATGTTTAPTTRMLQLK